MKGAFFISRKIFNSDLWDDVIKFRIFFYLIGHSVFSDEGTEVAGIKLERGQYLRSLRQIQDDLSYREGRGNSIKTYPLTTIQRKIKSLENEGRIKVKSTEYGTLFTVLNYQQYQVLDNYKTSQVEQQRNSNGTAMEQQWNNNKNDKNDKNDKKEIHYVEIVDYLNEKCGTKYKATTEKTKSMIRARWSEGFRVDDFKRVIDNKSSEWQGTDMQKYLRPETLFGNKFEGYLNQGGVIDGVNWGSHERASGANKELPNITGGQTGRIRPRRTV